MSDFNSANAANAANGKEKAKPKQAKVCLAQADEAYSGGVGTVAKSTSHIPA